MPERKYADSFEINIEKLMDLVMFQMEEKAMTEEDAFYEYYNAEDEKRISFLEERIKNVVGLDEEFKRWFNSDLAITAGNISVHAFENGLRIGLSLLKSLLTAETPEIHVVHHEPLKTSIPVQPSSDLDTVLVDCLKNVIPYLKNEQKKSLYNDIKSAFITSAEEILNLF